MIKILYHSLFQKFIFLTLPSEDLNIYIKPINRIRPPANMPDIILYTKRNIVFFTNKKNEIPLGKTLTLCYNIFIIS